MPERVRELNLAEYSLSKPPPWIPPQQRASFDKQAGTGVALVRSLDYVLVKDYDNAMQVQVVTWDPPPSTETIIANVTEHCQAFGGYDPERGDIDETFTAKYPWPPMAWVAQALTDQVLVKAIKMRLQVLDNLPLPPLPRRYRWVVQQLTARIGEYVK